MSCRSGTSLWAAGCFHRASQCGRDRRSAFAALDREEAFDITRRWIKNVISASKSSVTAAFTSRRTSKGRPRLTRINSPATCCSAYQPISAARPLALAMDSPIYWRVRGLQITGASMPPLPLRSMRPEQLSPSGVHHLRVHRWIIARISSSPRLLNGKISQFRPPLGRRLSKKIRMAALGSDPQNSAGASEPELKPRATHTSRSP
jgi:hypothetical protein